MAIPLGTIYAAVGLHTWPLETGVVRARLGLARLNMSMDHTSKSVAVKSAAMFGKFSLLGVGAFTLVAAASVKMASDLESSMRQVWTLTDWNKTQLDSWRGKMLELSRDVPKSAKDLADGLYWVKSAAIADADAMDVLTIAAKMASAGNIETKMSVDALTTAINSYGGNAKLAASYADDMWMAVARGKTTFEMIASNLAKAAPSAGALGITFKELMAAFSTMTQKGFKPSTAMMALNRFIIGTVKPSKAAMEMMDKYDIKYGAKAVRQMGIYGWLNQLYKKTKGNKDLMVKMVPEIRKLFVVFGLAGQGTAHFRKELALYEKDHGKYLSAFEKTRTELQQQIDLLKNRVQYIAIKFGFKLMPGVLDFTKTLSDAIDASIDPNTPKTRGKFGAPFKTKSLTIPLALNWELKHGKGSAYEKWAAVGTQLGGAIRDGILGVIVGMFSAVSGTAVGNTYGSAFGAAFGKALMNDPYVAALLGGVIGFKLGGPAGALIGATGGLGVYGVRNPNETPIEKRGNLDIFGKFFDPRDIPKLWGQTGAPLFKSFIDFLASQFDHYLPPDKPKPKSKRRALLDGPLYSSPQQGLPPGYQPKVPVKAGVAAKVSTSSFQIDTKGAIRAWNILVKDLEIRAGVLQRRMVRWMRQVGRYAGTGLLGGRSYVMRSWNLIVKALERGAILANARSRKWGKSFAVNYAAGIRAGLGNIRAEINQILAILALLDASIGGGGSGRSDIGNGLANRGVYNGPGGGGSGFDPAANFTNRSVGWQNYSIAKRYGFNDTVTIPRAYAGAQAINRSVGSPYVWGGDSESGADCSGFVSLVARAMGLLSGRLTSSSFGDWGSPGKGVFTVYGYPGNPGHVWLSLLNHYFQSSSGGIQSMGPRSGSYMRTMDTGGTITSPGLVWAGVKGEKWSTPKQQAEQAAIHNHYYDVGDIVIEGSAYPERDAQAVWNKIHRVSREARLRR